VRMDFSMELWPQLERETGLLIHYKRESLYLAYMSGALIRLVVGYCQRGGYLMM